MKLIESPPEVTGWPTRLDQVWFQHESPRRLAQVTPLLARNLAAARTGHPNAVAGKNDIDVIRREMEKAGFTFIPREVSRSVRGVTSNSHGTHPFANSGGCGSGFSSDRGGGGGFTSFGGGPGAVGGGVAWDKNSSKNLPMGSARRR